MTYLQRLLYYFPETELDETNVPKFCPDYLGYPIAKCDKQCNKCWGTLYYTDAQQDNERKKEITNQEYIQSLKVSELAKVLINNVSECLDDYNGNVIYVCSDGTEFCESEYLMALQYEKSWLLQAKEE